MSEMRGLPRGPLSRGTKTAAVVILAVLLQVIVVAVLGLGAITRDRKEGARLADERARADAEQVATKTLEALQTGVEDAVREAARVAGVAREPGSLRNITRENWSRAFTEMYRVDADGRFRSLGGLLLHVPPDVAAEEERRADPRAAERLEAEIASLADPRTADTPQRAAQRDEKRREYARRFWFRTDEVQYPVGVGQAHLLAEEAVAALGGKSAGDAPAAATAATDAILFAAEAVFLNEGRPRVGAVHLDEFHGWLDGLAAQLPVGPRETLAQSLADLRRARQRLPSIREWVLPEAKAMARAPAPPKVFPARGDDLVAVAEVPKAAGQPREALVVRIDRRILAARAEGDEAAPAAKVLDLSTRVVPRTDPSPAGDVAARRPLFAPPAFDAGLDVVVLRTAPLPATFVGPREAFYLAILGLATLGLTVAGLVLLRIYRREVHLARLKADFVSNLSHELKTPLTSISMFVEMIREGRLASPEDLREGMDVIAQESERLQRIVARMIEVARREAEPVRHDLVPGDLNAAVRSACERFRRLERHPGLSLEVSLAAGLPPVRLDPAAIDDAVTNLLSNAWKYRQGDAASIRVATRAARRAVELTVEDDGIGIPRGERRRIFEMFYRAEDYLSRAVPGTGLGLALVRTIVRAHRGKVRVEGAPGKGTTFRLRFPAVRGAGAPPVPPPALAAAPPAAPAERTPLGGTR
jgi:signal transduction histidine kinase